MFFYSSLGGGAVEGGIQKRHECLMGCTGRCQCSLVFWSSGGIMYSPVPLSSGVTV